MSQQRVAVRCPSCSPSAETAHEVLNHGGQATVRCSECSHVHKTTIEEESRVDRRVIVSQDDESTEARVEVPPEEELSTGDEFLVETDEAILTARITSIETTEGARVDEASAEDVKTLWTRAVGNVAVNLTLHPKDGGHDETRSVKIQVPGDEEFVVGRTHEYGGEEFTVERLLVREDATNYYREGYDHAGDAALAKDLKRVYARDENSTQRAWSAW
ncbi:HVO_0476 family zinc finger protein [Natronomonas gomsonensis]|uniref:HVO_0476 family zinc finger protein n=1 Tax=Natronomonas gomsonensis TaxID=1046043 RepID=UPI0015BCD0F1|nr:HVO_0476 family zinc finger protein [Natronomonas gomsonensis]